ncbi:MAG: DUF1559 domain-containing protein [Pirellulales bacterium]
MSRRIPNGVSLVELMVCLTIISILTALLLQGVQAVREASRRMACQNNLKQIALALHSFHDAHSLLPPGHRSKLHPDKMEFSGWTLNVLPYLEQYPLYTEATKDYANQSSPFRPPHSGLSRVVPTFLCPSDGRVVQAQYYAKSDFFVGLTSFLGVAGESAVDVRNGLLFSDSRESLKTIADGTSNTLLIGERPPNANYRFGWWYAGAGQLFTGSCDMVLGTREPNVVLGDFDPSCGGGRYSFRPSRISSECGAFHFWSLHPNGANFALADGSIRLIGYQAEPILPALSTKSGSEIVEVP